METRSRNLARSVVTSVIILQLLAGCMNMRVVSEYDSDSPVPHEETRWSWFWGLKQSTDIQTGDKCESICIVTSKTNLGYILISAATLGIAVPMTVEYECCPYTPDPGEL